MGELTGNGLICVGIPRERLLLPNFVDSRDLVIYDLQKRGIFGGSIQQPGCRIDSNRNKIVKEFLDDPRRAEWLIQLDNDMVYPQAIGWRLAQQKKPVIAPLYFHSSGQHDPVCYYEGMVRQNEWGESVMFYAPLWDEVYDFLEKCGVPRMNHPLTIDLPAGQEQLSLREIAGVGGGGLMVHRSVYEAMKPPWFYFDGTTGEDFVFCRRVREELGLPVFVDLSVICGHTTLMPVGQSEFRHAYEKRGFEITRYGEQHAIEWVTEFFGIPRGEAEAILATYDPSCMADLWRERNPQTAADVLKFYQDEAVGQMYVIELLSWNLSDAHVYLRQQLIQQRSGGVLEIGSGIGTVAMQLAIQRNDVVAVEPNDILREFTNYRWNWLRQRHDLGDACGNIYLHKEMPDGLEFDLVVALDVFEHIHPDQLPRLLRRVGKMVGERGRMFYHNNWEQQDIFPFHYDHGDAWETYLRRSGFYEINPPFWAMKIK